MPSFTDTFHVASIPAILAIVTAALAYGLWWRRLRAAHGPDQVRARHAAMFGGGLLILAIALVGPIDWVGERRLMAGHMVQHILVFSVVPALVLIGIPLVAWPRAVFDTTLFGAARTAVLCAVGGVAAVWLLHVPGVLDAGLRRPALNDLQHVPLLLAGFALAWPLAGPRPVGGLAAVGYLVIIELGIGVLGIWLTWFPEVVYDTYLQVPRLWGLDAGTDQSLAGAILLVVGEPFVAVEVAILFIRALGEADRQDEDEDEDDRTFP